MVYSAAAKKPPQEALDLPSLSEGFEEILTIHSFEERSCSSQ
jgi:hypothetical protein